MKCKHALMRTAAHNFPPGPKLSTFYESRKVVCVWNRMILRQELRKRGEL